MKRRRQLGFTLVEMLVGVVIGSLVLLGAVAFAQQEIQMLGISREVLDMTQTGRITLDLLADDLANAGVGVGYNEAGQFRGLEVGGFTRGGAIFSSSNVTISVTAGDTPTDDIGLMMADGDHVTIAGWLPPTAMQVCGPTTYEVGDVVLLRSADGLSARTVSLVTIQPGICLAAVSCQNGCVDATFAADGSYDSGDSAADANYEGGYVAGGFKALTWFVETTDPSVPNVGRLRRVNGTCTDRDMGCGEIVADNVEALQMRIYELDPGTGWVDRTELGGPITTANRLRVDLELVLRARVSDITGQGHPPARMILEPWCLPGGNTAVNAPCAADPDSVRRLVMRATVELKNSGRMRYQEGG